MTSLRMTRNAHFTHTESFCHQVNMEKNMDTDSLIQHVERDMEATSFPLPVTTDWLDDGNETTVNLFQQPDWQVGGIERDHRLKWWKSEPAH